MRTSLAGKFARHASAYGGPYSYLAIRGIGTVISMDIPRKGTEKEVLDLEPFGWTAVVVKPSILWN